MTGCVHLILQSSERCNRLDLKVGQVTPTKAPPIMTIAGYIINIIQMLLLYLLVFMNLNFQHLMNDWIMKCLTCFLGSYKFCSYLHGMPPGNPSGYKTPFVL